MTVNPVTASYATFLTLTDAILQALEKVDALYNNPYIQDVYVDISTQKYEAGQLNAKDKSKKSDASPAIQQDLDEEETIASGERGGPIEEEVETEGEDGNDILRLQENPESKKMKRSKSISKSEKLKRRKSQSPQRKGSVTSGRKSTEERKLKRSGLQNESNPQDVMSQETNSVKEANNERQSEKLLPIVQDQFMEEKNRRVYQAKRMLFQDLLADGIERMLCAVDGFKEMKNYRPPNNKCADESVDSSGQSFS